MTVEEHIKRFDKIRASRYTWESLWQECADYCLPQKANITRQRSPGEKLKTNVYDSTAIESVPIAASGLHSYLTNPSSRWFDLEMEDKKLMDHSQVRGWIKDCVDIEFDTFNATNFNAVLPEFYSDFVVFGNPCIYQEEDLERVMNFFVRPISEIFFLVNDRGMIDTIYRAFTWSARQAYQKWQGKAGEEAVKAVTENNDPEKSISYLHAIFPRDERDTRRMDARNMPFSSLYIDPKHKIQISESGYHEFPAFIPRFYKTSDSEYAYSSASVGLADIKMLNQMSKDILRAAQKTINPPIILPNDGFLLPFKTGADAINFKVSSSPDDKVEALEIKRELNLSLEMLNQRRQSIARIFFVDLFLMLANLPEKQRTATEIAERVNERMLILGPALGRLMETLSGIVIRGFNILYRLGKLPEPPQILKGQQFKVKFISPLAKAQRAAEARSVGELLTAVQAMSELNPEAMDNFDFDKATKKFGEIYNTADVLRSDEEIQAIRENRAKLQQEQAQAAMMQPGAKAIKDLADAQKASKGGE